MITVHLPPDLAAKFHATAELAVSATTLGEMVAQLNAQHPGLHHWLVEVDGRFRPHLAVFVSGDKLAQADASIPLPDGADVWVIRAVSGG